MTQAHRDTRAEQDRAYEESLAADRAKEAERQREEEAAREQERLERERVAAEAHMAEQEAQKEKVGRGWEERSRRSCQMISSSLPLPVHQREMEWYQAKVDAMPNPGEDVEDKITIQFRLPNRSRKTRNFLPSARVEDVFFFLGSEGFSPEAHVLVSALPPPLPHPPPPLLTPPPSPKVTAHPRRTVKCNDPEARQSLTEFGLSKREVLNVEEL